METGRKGETHSDMAMASLGTSGGRIGQVSAWRCSAHCSGHRAAAARDVDARRKCLCPTGLHNIAVAWGSKLLRRDTCES